MFSKSQSASSENKHEKRVLDFNYKVLCYFGLWPSENIKSQRNFWQRFRSFIPAVQITRISLMTAFHLFAIVAVWHEPHLRSKEITRVIAHFMMIMKIGTLMYRRQSIGKLFETLEQLNDDVNYVDEICEKRRRSAALWCRGLSKLFTFGCLIINVLMFVLAYKSIKKSWMEPIDIWFPQKTFWYELFMIVVTPMLLLGMFDLFTMVISDVTWLAALIQTVTHMDILKYRLENIRLLVRSRAVVSALPTAVPTSPPPASHKCSNISKPCHNLSRQLSENDIESLVLDLEDIAVIKSDEEKNQFVGKEDFKGDLIREVSAPSEIELQMEQYLTDCVKRHTILIRTCKDLQRIFSPILGFHAILLTVLALLTLYISILVSKLGRVNDDVVVTAFFFILGVLEFFILCYSSDKLTEKSSAIREAAYACDWLEATEGFKRSLRIIMCRTTKPIIVRALGIPLSLPTFKAAMRAIYYIHTMSLNIINGKKITDKRL